MCGKPASIRKVQREFRDKPRESADIRNNYELETDILFSHTFFSAIISDFKKLFAKYFRDNLICINLRSILKTIPVFVELM